MISTDEHVGNRAGGHSLYLTEAQYCNRYQLSSRTAQRQRVEGTGPSWTRLGVRRIGYSEAALVAWEASRTFCHRAAEIAGQAGLT